MKETVALRTCTSLLCDETCVEMFDHHSVLSAAPAKAPPAPPPPPPPGEGKKEDTSAAAEEEEVEPFQFEILGHPLKLPQLPKLPPMPDWLRAILDYRFPSSIDPFTGESVCLSLTQRGAEEHHSFFCLVPSAPQI